MLTTPEESNHLPGFANRRVAVGKCARAHKFNKGEADGGDDFFGICVHASRTAG